MALVTAQMSVSLDGFYSGPEHLDAGFHRVTRWVIDTMAWRERQGFEGGEHNTNSEVIQEMVGAPGSSRRRPPSGTAGCGSCSTSSI